VPRRTGQRGEGIDAERTQVVYIPLKLPWTRPATLLDGAWIQLAEHKDAELVGMNDPCLQLSTVGAGRAEPRRDGAALECFGLLLLELSAP
jgi:hypothetical protein